jgi:hypothetical protein
MVLHAWTTSGLFSDDDEQGGDTEGLLCQEVDTEEVDIEGCHCLLLPMLNS